jgi:hypothetical protein
MDTGLIKPQNLFGRSGEKKTLSPAGNLTLVFQYLPISDPKLEPKTSEYKAKLLGTCVH